MAELLRNLDEPQRIWEQIVENDLDDAAVHILEVLFASGQASYEELQGTWSRYQRELELPADERPAGYEQVKHRFHAAQESNRQATANLRYSDAGFVSWSQAILAGPDTRCRIGLLMDGLRHLQDPSQE